MKIDEKKTYLSMFEIFKFESLKLVEKGLNHQILWHKWKVQVNLHQIHVFHSWVKSVSIFKKFFKKRIKSVKRCQSRPFCFIFY